MHGGQAQYNVDQLVLFPINPVHNQSVKDRIPHCLDRDAPVTVVAKPANPLRQIRQAFGEFPHPISSMCISRTLETRRIGEDSVRDGFEVISNL